MAGKSENQGGKTATTEASPVPGGSVVTETGPGGTKVTETAPASGGTVVPGSGTQQPDPGQAPGGGEGSDEGQDDTGEEQ
jgi:hypothetical protein